MKIKLYGLALISLLLFATPLSAQDKTVVSDPTVAAPERNYTDADEELVTAKILPKIRDRWKEDGCDGSSLNVIAAVDGAFTEKAAAQRAIVYEMCQTGNGFANNGIAIVEGGNVVANFVTEGGWNLAAARVPDINKNGYDELAVEQGGGMHQGYTGSSVDVLEISPAVVTSLGTFLTYTNECENHKPDQYCDRSYKITAKPGKTPAFTRQMYVNKGDDETPKWASSGKSQPAKPISGVETKYTLVK